MIKCSHCNKKHVKNTVFCDECGQYLGEDASRTTESFLYKPSAPPSKRSRDTLSISGSRPAQTGALSKQPDRSLPVIRLRLGPERRTVEYRLSRTIHLGRLDPSHDIYPDIDLTEDDRLTRQVSRRHLRILDRGSAIMIEDLGSFNGTFLNGKKLSPFEPTKISPGDQLQLGSLPVEVLEINQ